MIILLPVPTWVASMMQGVQKSKMKSVCLHYIHMFHSILITHPRRPTAVCRVSRKVRTMRSHCNTFANSWIVMSVLRMIKLFGWESRVKETVAEKRENELGWIWKRKMLSLANNCIK